MRVMRMHFYNSMLDHLEHEQHFVFYSKRAKSKYTIELIFNDRALSVFFFVFYISLYNRFLLTMYFFTESFLFYFFFFFLFFIRPPRAYEAGNILSVTTGRFQHYYPYKLCGRRFRGCLHTYINIHSTLLGATLVKAAAIKK